MPDQDRNVNRAEFPDRWLTRSWWVLFPCFTALTLRLVFERACRDPSDLLPALTSEPRWAWPLALAYVLAHLWVLAAYLVTVSRTQELLPRLSTFGAVWGTDRMKLVFMFAMLTIEYSPISVWRLIGTTLRCTR
jgi:uncharacterized membrane protein YhdT